LRILSFLVLVIVDNLPKVKGSSQKQLSSHITLMKIIKNSKTLLHC